MAMAAQAVDEHTKSTHEGTPEHHYLQHLALKYSSSKEKTKTLEWHDSPHESVGKGSR